MFTEKQIAAFWSKVVKGGPSYIDRDGADRGPCWLWQGQKAKRGYGRPEIGGKRYFAHRVAWMVVYGDVADGLYVLHKCDVTNCVAPRHLWLGTAADNAADMVAKGRQACGDRNGTRLYPDRLRHGKDNHFGRFPQQNRGANNPSARLSVEDVLTVLRLRVEEQASYSAIAQRFGITSSQVGHIVRGQGWKDLATCDSRYSDLMQRLRKHADTKKSSAVR